MFHNKKLSRVLLGSGFLMGVVFLLGIYAERTKIYRTLSSAFLNKPTASLNKSTDGLPPDLTLEIIKSKKDDNSQEILFFKSKTKSKVLIVSLHGWRERYNDHDELANFSITNDYNYIRPSFRGQNNKPSACCSKLVLSDLDEAIDFAQEDQAWIKDIHVIGRSGGGYAGACMLMKSKHTIKHFMLWVPMTNLVSWHYQQVNRKNILYKEVLECTNSKNGILNIAEAQERSPFFSKTPVNKLKNTKVSLFAGVYDQTVPITQPINFYHKLIRDSGAKDSKFFVDDETIIKYATKSHQKKPKILYSNKYKNITIYVFNGGHEIDYEYMENYFSSLS